MAEKTWQCNYNPLYTGGFFHCYMLDKSICHSREARANLLLLFYFDSKQCRDPDQMPHHVASDLGLHCLPMTLLRASK